MPEAGARVAVTGMGAISPAGADVDANLEALRAARSTTGPIAAWDASGHAVQFAAEIADFDPTPWVEPRHARRIDRVSLLAISAAEEAIAQAGRGEAQIDPARVGVVIGSCVGGFAMLEAGARQLEARGPERISPHLIGAMLVDTPTSYVATDLGVRGPNFSIVSACATGAHSIGEAAEMVRRGDADRILAGGVEACITELILGGFCNMRALGSAR
jgi:3-oxoacyl-[acyl-carrier-protein] synthase II